MAKFRGYVFHGPAGEHWACSEPTTHNRAMTWVKNTIKDGLWDEDDYNFVPGHSITRGQIIQEPEEQTPAE